ncbi:hypothetical protein C4580_05865 [Candidatus Woesearchaeota archaeon]|nr:MAG: hypothetical protein C4580_05865 [Candidatus Woesearchaeota archaeon]
MMFQLQYTTGGERLTQVFSTLNNYGFQDFFLPFLLIFALVFAILQKVQLFTTTIPAGTGTTGGVKPDRRINGFIAAAVAAMVVVPHVLRLYPPNMDPVEMMLWVLPTSAVGLIAVMLGLLFVGFMVQDPSKVTGVSASVGLIGAALVLIAALKSILPAFLPQWLVIDTQTQTILIVIGALLVTVYFIISEPEEPKKSTSQKLKELFGP